MKQWTRILLLIATVSFVPSIIPLTRRYRLVAAIVLLDILLGWTLLGWIIALVWSFTGDSNHQKIQFFRDSGSGLRGH
jgi:Superinfection immunity protein